MVSAATISSVERRVCQARLLAGAYPRSGGAPSSSAMAVRPGRAEKAKLAAAIRAAIIELRF